MENGSLKLFKWIEIGEIQSERDTNRKKPKKKTESVVKMEKYLSAIGIDVSCALNSLRHGTIPHKDCLLPLISKLLGYAIVAASTTVKLPQIMKILKHQSVRGLSMISFELEVVGYTIALAYCLHKGLPFSAYGELLFLLIQALILVAIIYYYSRPLRTTTWIRALIYCAVAPTILAGQIDPFLFEALYASQHAIFLFARIPQILKNFSNRSTGELSFLTSLMNSAGSMVRVFTSLQENAPKSVVMGSAIGVATNFTILSQILFYQKPRVTEKEKKTK
ncbi:hypothetical protein HN51_017582 [Arachis hypogaea]|uniref:Mannose-P-dolichol utilization defect 1 protein homolog n=2 Tax=Arachis TaxID=3817 RepID=A0A445CXU7_ARAHY|nr:mannose-P-dolichol utilization defect 1 protein homolog 2 [Arachis duranensis]XP_016163069.1 mannose-P-dolichol utilization defect 1 protein homolog 2 [Arachis ipaensis]XP_025606908.1 mannose-P-dolichol utilization defect 1 protein homolog 2-like [Arachis hypogaea]XP_025660309.1 mannose-P-dolichol utilization defect 1 protein homolog 2-like [Arachis hypogaea]XP_057718136.1 mannose-P-dolichol utilization defect 1 protein homolog 2 [Arachis stenosperma]QHN88524.1 uncharacterized protein DS421